jgi:hypothetical protein
VQPSDEAANVPRSNATMIFERTRRGGCHGDHRREPLRIPAGFRPLGTVRPYGRQTPTVR